MPFHFDLKWFFFVSFFLVKRRLEFIFVFYLLLTRMRASQFTHIKIMCSRSSALHTPRSSSECGQYTILFSVRFIYVSKIAGSFVYIRFVDSHSRLHISGLFHFYSIQNKIEQLLWAPIYLPYMHNCISFHHKIEKSKMKYMHVLFCSCTQGISNIRSEKCPTKIHMPTSCIHPSHK